jgi:hypothetical protein
VSGICQPRDVMEIEREGGEGEKGRRGEGEKGRRGEGEKGEGKRKGDKPACRDLSSSSRHRQPVQRAVFHCLWPWHRGWLLFGNKLLPAWRERRGPSGCRR